VKVPAGAALKQGSTGKRVALLRNRLGLPSAGGFDPQLEAAVRAYQEVHGLGSPDGIAGKATISSLNRGATHYARRIAVNMERAYRLPQTRTFDRYVVVDSGAAETFLFDRDRIVDRMRVIVGTPKTETPMMAVLMRNAKANPYWNVPPELVRSLTAKRIGEQGLSYLRDFHYEVLADWSPNAPIINPKTVNWRAIASGKQQPTIRVRQLPGPWNSMRNMKFATTSASICTTRRIPSCSPRTTATSATAACGSRIIGGSRPGCSAGCPSPAARVRRISSCRGRCPST
jgi:murein L,D-transpeptidase YcbB/YkuD